MYCYSEQAKNNTVFLFRFAVTDYFAGNLEINIYPDRYHGDTYMAQETMFFNFDIIQLTFNRDGIYKIIPVVSSPINIINDVTPPLEGDGWLDFIKDSDWFKNLLMILALILFLIILIPFLPMILNVLIFIVMLPFKLIGSVIRGLKDVSRDRKIKALQKANKKRD
jgi:hypothetical protein